MAARKTPARKSAASKSPKGKSQLVIRNAPAADLLDRFQDFVLKDRNVQENLRNVGTARGVAKLAKKHGFQLSERNIRAAARMAGGGLSVDDLGGLISGAPCWCNKSVVNSKSCKK